MALTIQFNNDTKTFLIGSTLADTGKLRISYEGVLIYDNFQGASDDIVNGASTSTPPTKTDGGGNIQKGVYTFEYDNTGDGEPNLTEQVNFQVNPLSFCLDVFSDTYTPQLTVEDKSVYLIGNEAVINTINRTLTLGYPTQSGQTSIVETSTSIETLAISTSVIFTGAQQAVLDGDVLFDVSGTGIYSNFTYFEAIKAYESIIINADNDLCNVYCCLKGLQTKISNYQNKNRDVSSLLEDYNYASSLISQYREAINCNKISDLTDVLNTIKRVLNCDGCDCEDCNDDFPRRVYGIIPANQTGGDSGGGGGGGVTNFVGLTDTPSEINPDQIWFGNPSGDALEQRNLRTSDLEPALEATELIEPIPTGTFLGDDFWEVTKNNGTPYTFLVTNAGDRNIQVDVGCVVNLSLASNVTTPAAGEALPTDIRIGGQSFGVPTPPTNTGSFTDNNITTNNTYNVVYTKPASGLVADLVTGQVLPATGNDTKSQSVSVSFRNRVYFGAFTFGATIDEALIKSLSTERFGDKTETFSNVTDGAGNRLGFFYPSSLGNVTNIILDGAAPILGAWTQLGDIAFINEGGISVPMTGVISNAPNSYSNNSLQFS